MRKRRKEYARVSISRSICRRSSFGSQTHSRVSTSTAGFIGVFPNQISIPPFGLVEDEVIGKGEEVGTEAQKKPRTSFDLANYPVSTDPNSFEIQVNNQVVAKTKARVINDDANKKSRVVFDEDAAPQVGSNIKGKYISIIRPVINEKIGKGEEVAATGTEPKTLKTTFDLASYPVLTGQGTFEIRIKVSPLIRVRSS
jgi:hypothetical protein